MNEDDIRVPVFLITGFLESGKTTFLNNTVQQEYFSIPEQTLLLNCEQGEVEYNPERLDAFRVDCVDIHSMEELGKENLTKIDEAYQPARVLIEFNPLWSMDAFHELELPDGWGVIQEIVVVDASTFQVYMNNMKSLFVEMTRQSDMVIFNRSTPDLPLANFRRSIKVVNPACQVLFETPEGEMTDIFEDSVPYDLDADVIKIEDVDYGIFYVDAREHPERYKGKVVRFKGRVMRSRVPDANYFVPGRQAMTCCADDTQFIGYLCESKFSPKLKEGNWIELTAEVGWGYHPLYREEGPILHAKAIKNASAPEVDMVYFS